MVCTPDNEVKREACVQDNMRTREWRRGDPSIMLFLICLLSLTVPGCRTEGPSRVEGFISAPVSGMIYDQDSRPCGGVTVVLDEEQITVSDIDGRFVFPSIASGSHQIRFEKESHETVFVDFPFRSRTQVLYVRMVSLPQLLGLAEASISEGEWREAADLLDRAEAIREDNPVAGYLRAILALRRGDSEGAVSRLETLAADPYPEPVIFLSLADLYEYKLGAPDSAVLYLKRYLELTGDSHAEERLKALEEQRADGPPRTETNP